ncbi:MAG TPA: glycoside hydrolase family 88 protein [Bacteroidota bacterium]|nr:glycoside hydrolase family 88 protein [Bacteroidota bacterium]
MTLLGKISFFVSLSFFALSFALSGEKRDSDARRWSDKIAESFLARHPGYVTYDSGSPNQKWNYEQGLMLEAFHQMWLFTGNKKYFDFIKGNIDHYVADNGSITSYSADEYSLDNIGPGRALLTLYKETDEHKYLAAAETLRKQLDTQPRTYEGGFWHKKIYPYQMWLDGLFMAEPFYGWYASRWGEKKDFDDIINQFVFIARHVRDPKTGLFYHAWDESRSQKWADPVTGCSPSFWSRAMGWYCMALVDVLDFIPKDDARRDTLIVILKDLSASIAGYRDSTTGLWYQVMDQGARAGNYFEASASCMFVYAFAKGAALGYLDPQYSEMARSSFNGILRNLVTIEDGGLVDLHHTCKGAGLGGRPYRDGSYEYYIGEPQRTNDLKGIGAFLLAAIEVEKSQSARFSH